MSDIRSCHAAGKWGKVVAARLAAHTDIYDGIKAICEAHGIKQGAVLFGLGSVRKLTYQVLVSRPETKLGAGYDEPREIDGPVEVVSLSGFVFQSEDGQTVMHLHGAFSDQNGNVYGGHLVQGRNPVLATLETVIAEIADVTIVRQMDEQVGLRLPTPV